MISQLLLSIFFGTLAVLFLFVGIKGLKTGTVRNKNFVEHRATNPVGFRLFVVFLFLAGLTAAFGAVYIWLV